jgi:FtsZ-interacting cell division protein ZipA
MSSLQIALIVAGVLLVIGVILYNQWQERRATREAIERTQRTADMRAARAPDRVEPTLSTHAAAPASEAREGVATYRSDGPPAEAFDVPGDVIPLPEELREPVITERVRVTDVTSSNEEAAQALATSTLVPSSARQSSATLPMPDHEIECLIPLKPAAPVGIAELGRALGARVGKPVRWFGRADARSDWEPLSSDTMGEFSELVACLLLADRNGAATKAQLDAFVRNVADVAPSIQAPFDPPDLSREVTRAESLDRLCAELDVQIGLTVQKPDPGSIAGTRLRGVAEASGFRLAPGGRFEFVNEDTGAILYTLQNLRADPFTAESLRLTATNGVVFLLDVARCADPVRTFDQMKMAARRMATTLGAELVDDNHRPLDDAALGKIREQVNESAEALRAVHIEPGSPRALALFNA